MATELEIVNAALLHLGQMSVTSAEYTTGTKNKALKVIKERIANLKRAFLRRHPFNCSVRRAFGMPLYNTVTITVEYPDETTEDDVLTYQSTDVGYESSNREWTGTNYGIRRDTNGRWTFMDDTLTTTYNYNDKHKSFSCQSPILFEEKTWNTDWDETDTAIRRITAISYDDLNDSSRSVHGYGCRILKPVTYGVSTRPVRFLNAHTADKRDFRAEGDYIHISEQQHEFSYIEDIDYSSFDDLMAEVFPFYLAYHLSWSIEQDKEHLQMLESMLRRSLSTARTIDSQEDGTYDLDVDAFYSDRYGPTIYDARRLSYNTTGTPR